MKISSFIVLLLAMLVITACASKRVDMIAEGQVEVILAKSNDVEFSKADVHLHGQKTEIQIVVRPKERTRFFQVGSIDILLVHPDGSEQRISTDNARVDRHAMGSKLQHAHFVILIPTVLPVGSVVQVRYLPSN